MTSKLQRWFGQNRYGNKRIMLKPGLINFVEALEFKPLLKKK